jgi:hypothetical protein
MIMVAAVWAAAPGAPTDKKKEIRATSVDVADHEGI